jgi:ribosome-binding protein aMBF1 (putative translation factor)
MDDAAARPPRSTAGRPRADRSGERARPLERLRERTLRRPVPKDADDVFYVAVADKVIEQRLARDLSQAELAELCGTTQSAIARVERGRRPPRIDTLLRIANALDCELVIDLRPRTLTEEEQ